MGYWGTVADRLFKIRHCMNIEGVVRELLLFELPIESALLVRAAAAGVDLGSVLNDINTPTRRAAGNDATQVFSFSMETRCCAGGNVATRAANTR